MKNKAGRFFMGAGAVLIAAALILLMANWRDDLKAGQASAAVMPIVQAAVAASTANSGPAPEGDMVVDIDDNGYIGYLTIPALSLELPIMSDWDYDRLKLAPCRQAGSALSDDLVIAGHNYKRHFGAFSQLEAGDMILFTELDGNVNQYRVAALEQLRPTDTQAVLDNQFDLTLYTCTPGGENRVTVFCQRVEETSAALYAH